MILFGFRHFTHVDRLLYNRYSKRVYDRLWDSELNYFTPNIQQQLKLAKQADYCEGII